MGRYSGGSDRPFWLEAWAGGRHVVERVSGTIVVNHLLVGIVGSFQPDKLARAFQGDEDGMYGRFLYGWASTPDYRPLINEVAEIEPELQSALKALIRLPAEDADNAFIAQAVPLSQEAIEKFEEYRRHVDKMKRALDGVERQWLVKSESQVLRLAGALTYFTWAFTLGIQGALSAMTSGQMDVGDQRPRDDHRRPGAQGGRRGVHERCDSVGEGIFLATRAGGAAADRPHRSASQRPPRAALDPRAREARSFM